MSGTKVTKAEQRQIVILWRQGYTGKQIAASLDRQPATITRWLRKLSDQGIIPVRRNKRLRNPLGYKKKLMWWSKKRRYCPHGHYMSKRNSISERDGRVSCRKCYNAYMAMHHQIARSGFLEV